MKLDVTYRVFGDHAVLLDWSPQINEQTHGWVLQVDHWLLLNFKSDIVETVRTYHSIAIYLHRDIVPQEFIQLIKTTTFIPSTTNNENTYLITIPVCYESSLAIDMDEVVRVSGLSSEHVVSLHTKVIYTIFFMGFLPGFPYLGGLTKELFIPRRDSPRSSIDKGSVAIGGVQTGIYPSNSPGGWHVIGKTPLVIFDINKSEPSIFKGVEKVQFRSISLTEFQSISSQVAAGKYSLEKEVWRG